MFWPKKKGDGTERNIVRIVFQKNSRALSKMIDISKKQKEFTKELNNLHNKKWW